MPKKTTPKSSRGLHAVRLPGETPKYRAARDKLLKNEIALRRQIEAVAAERRKLPLGGALKEDYVFDELASATDHTAVRREVGLSELFAKGKDTLVVYSYMFGPQMAAPCPLCTSMLDSLAGSAPHITQRINLAVVAKSPIDRIRYSRDDRILRKIIIHGAEINLTKTFTTHATQSNAIGP